MLQTNPIDSSRRNRRSSLWLTTVLSLSRRSIDAETDDD